MELKTVSPSSSRHRSNSRRRGGRRRKKKHIDLLDKNTRRREVNKVIRTFLYLLYCLQSVVKHFYKIFERPVNFAAGLVYVVLDFLLLVIMFIVHFLWSCLVNAYLAVIQLARKKQSPPRQANAGTVGREEREPGASKSVAGTRRSSTETLSSPSSEEQDQPPAKKSGRSTGKRAPPKAKSSSQRSLADQAPRPDRPPLHVPLTLKNLYDMIRNRVDRGTAGEVPTVSRHLRLGESRRTSRYSLNEPDGPNVPEIISSVVSDITSPLRAQASEEARDTPISGPSGQSRSGLASTPAEDKEENKVSEFFEAMADVLEEFKEQDKAAEAGQMDDDNHSDEGGEESPSSGMSTSFDEKEEEEQSEDNTEEEERKDGGGASTRASKVRHNDPDSPNVPETTRSTDNEIASPSRSRVSEAQIEDARDTSISGPSGQSRSGLASTPAEDKVENKVSGISEAMADVLEEPREQDKTAEAGKKDDVNDGDEGQEEAPSTGDTTSVKEVVEEEQAEEKAEEEERNSGGGASTRASKVSHNDPNSPNVPETTRSTDNDIASPTRSQVSEAQAEDARDTSISGPSGQSRSGLASTTAEDNVAGKVSEISEATADVLEESREQDKAAEAGKMDEVNDGDVREEESPSTRDTTKLEGKEEEERADDKAEEEERKDGGDGTTDDD